MANLVTSNEVVLGEKKKGGGECLNQTEAWISRPLQEHFWQVS